MKITVLFLKKKKLWGSGYVILDILHTGNMTMAFNKGIREWSLNLCLYPVMRHKVVKQ